MKRPLFVGIAAALALLIGVGVRQARDAGMFARGYERDVLPLVKAVGQRRFLAPRLTGGFQYGPLVQTKRAGGDSVSTNRSGFSDRPAMDDWNVLAAAASLRNVGGRPLAIASLLVGDPDESVRTLTEAARASPKDAHALSDLSAAYLQRAYEQDRPDDFPRAIDAASTALELEPDLQEAKFNRALGLQALSLTNGALRAWRDFVQHEPDGGWREEAQRSIARLVERPRIDFVAIERRLKEALATGADHEIDAAVSANVGLARDLFELTLLPDPTAATMSARLASSFERVTGDSYPQAMLKARGVREIAAIYREARQLYESGEWARSKPVFARVVSRSPPQSPFSIASRLHLDTLLYQENTKAARPLLKALAEEARSLGFALLEGRIRWVLALAELDGGDFDRAESDDLRARELFLKVGHQEWAAFMLSQRAEVLSVLANDEESARLRVQALSQIDSFRDPTRVRATLLSASDFFLDMGSPHASLAALDEVEVRESSLPPTRPRANLERHRVRAWLALGRLPPKELSDAARARAQAIADPIWKRREAQETELDISSAERDGSVVERLRTAIAAVEARGNDTALAGLYAELGRQLLADADVGGALEAARKGLLILERPRALRAELALTATDRAWGLYGLQLDALEKQGARPETTLAAADQAWRAAFSSLNQGGDVAPLLRDSFPALRSDQAVLGFFDHGARGWAWVIRSNGVRVVSLTMPSDLRAMLSSIEESADGNDLPGFARQCARVQPFAYAPLAPLLEGVSRLTIIPHGDFSRIPFGALRDDRSGQSLNERYRLSIAPTLAAALRPATVRLDRDAVSVIAASGPTSLPRLAHLESEARAVAGTYRKASLSLGAKATPSAVMDALRTSSIVHIASHTVLNPRRPLLSGFVMSGDRTLRALDLRGLEGISAKAVVLTACSGGKTISGRSFASPTLARFLGGAGVPIVVGSYFQWDDQSAAEAGRAIHASLVKGIGAVETVNRVAATMAGTSSATLFVQASVFEK